MDKIAENIAKLRIVNGLTQEQLAEKLDTTRQTVHNWENGVSVPRGKNLNLLCDTLGVTLNQLRGKEPLCFDKKIEFAIDGLKTNLKEEEKAKNEIKKAFRKKVYKIIIIVLVIITVLIFSCWIYNFSFLTNIGNKVSKYKNLENYYCKIKGYEGNYLIEQNEIWYKDNKYKIKKSLYNDIGQVKTVVTNIIDLDEDKNEIYNDGNYESTKEILEKYNYENGRYMYSLFPDILKDKIICKVKNSLVLTPLKLKELKEKSEYSLKIKSTNIGLEKDSYAPIFYTSGDGDKDSRMEFIIELDCVKDENLKM